jgi:signal peptidase I
VEVPPGIYPNASDAYYPTGQGSPPSTGGQSPASDVPPPSAPEPKKRREGLRSVISTALLLILAPLIALAITAFAFQSYQVEGASMEKTLSNNDRLIVNKIPRTWARITDGSYIPKRGEVIIFNQAGLYDAEGQPQKQLIKRVVGLPGERVVVKENTVIVYNEQNPEGFKPDLDAGYKIDAQETPGDVDTLVGDDEVFVLGDNRKNSEDSRYFGPVPSSQIVGKLTMRISPLDKIQKF